MGEPMPQTPPPPVPAAPAAPVPIQPPAKPKTFLFVLVGLVLVAGMLFVGIVLGQKGFLSGILPVQKSSPTMVPQPTPTPDPTVDWKIYTNEKYSFEFKYPSKKTAKFMEEPYNGFCNDNKRRGVVKLLLWPEGEKLPVEGEEIGVSDVSFFVYGEENEENLSIAKWVEKNCPQLLSSHKKENYEVSGLSAVKYTRIGEGMGAPEIQPYIFLLKNNKLFYIHPYGDKAIFDQILSTFKFLDQTSSTENWKTYNSKLYKNGNFSISFPSNWIITREENQSFNGVKIIDPTSMVDEYTSGAGKTGTQIPSRFVYISSVLSNETPKEYLDEEISKGNVFAPTAFVKDLKRKSFSLSGFPAEAYTGFGEGSRGRITLVSNGSRIYEINTPEDLEGSVVNEILLTFKFLEY